MKKPGTPNGFLNDLITRLLNYSMARDSVIASQGLRGFDFGVVWRREMSLPHWKPG